MLNALKAFRQDEYGVILSAEIVIVGTLLVLGVMTGMVCLQKSVNGELGDLAKAIDCIDQSYAFSGYRKAGAWGHSGGCCAFTAGSAYNNNECKTACSTDILGCEGQAFQNGNCGTCGRQCGSQCGRQCGSCGGQFRTDGNCGSCGHFGAAGDFNPNRPDCVSTGVPKMKVTEYPGTDNVPRTSNEGRSPLRFPELEVQPFEPAYRQPMPEVEQHFVPGRHQHDHSAIDAEQQVFDHVPPQSPELHPQRQFENIEPVSPIPPGAPGPAESNEPLRPIPETQPIPAVPPQPQA